MKKNSKLFILFSILFVKSPATNVFGQQAISTIPVSRWIHQITYDEKNNEILLFGGATNDKVAKAPQFFLKFVYLLYDTR